MLHYIRPKEYRLCLPPHLVVRIPRTGFTEGYIFMDDFASVNDFLATYFAVDTHASPTDDLIDGGSQDNFFDGYQLFDGHDLVRLQLGEVSSLLVGCKLVGFIADIQFWSYTYCPVMFGVDKGSRDFTIIFHPQGAVTNSATGGDLHPIGETTIGLQDGDQALCFLWDIDL
jgi:hypothetical protein